MARKLYNSLIEQEVIKGSIVETIDILKLENTNATNPLNGRNSRIIFGEHVEMSAGSGAVHTAPGHGEDDYKVSLKYGIEVIMPVDAYGKYDETIVREKLFKDSDKYLGFINLNSLLTMSCKRNIEIATNQSPLTKLPGNKQIERFIGNSFRNIQIVFI